MSSSQSLNKERMIEERRAKFQTGKNIFDLQQQAYEDTLKDIKNNTSNDNNL